MTRFTLVRRNLSRRRVRLILTILAISISFLLFGVTAAIRQNFSAEGPAGAAQRLVVANSVGFLEQLPFSAAQKVSNIPGIKLASHRSMAAAFYQERKNLFLLLAVDPEEYLKLYPELTVVPAEKKAFVAERSSMLVGRTLANRFGWKVGQVVPISQRATPESEEVFMRSLRVAGIFDSTSRSTGTGIAIFHYGPFNDGRVLQADTISSIVVQAQDPRQNESLAERIDAQFENSPNPTETMTEEAFGKALVRQLGDISRITVLVASASFLAILLIAGSTFAASIRERHREIGILRLLGFMPSSILKMLLTEALLITLVGGLIGLALASIVVNALRNADAGTFGRLSITPEALGQAAFLIIAFGLIAALPSAWRAHRIDVVTALQRR